MADLIDRQAVVNAICEMHVGGQDAVKNALPNTYGADLREIIEEIDALPSAVVQCKDCKHRIEHKHYGDLGESAYTCEGNMGGWILPEGFCSYGERKE